VDFRAQAPSGKPSVRQFVIIVVLFVIGIIIAAAGLQGLLNPNLQPRSTDGSRLGPKPSSRRR
jgi:hypothetical protein